MFGVWKKNITQNLQLVETNRGPAFAIVISGSEADRAYWKHNFERVAYDVFRANGDTLIHSVCEGVRKGNFLGTFNGWQDSLPVWASHADQLPNIALMSMVFGQGKRLSPFTQTMGNRKSAFQIPMRSQNEEAFLSVADLSNIYTNLWLHHLESSGFRGLIVKWGDEAILPGADWAAQAADFAQVDALRFVWRTEPTEDLAREKDWVVIDAQTGLMRAQFPRQQLESLKARVAELGQGDYSFGVNLGSLAISYEFLDVALEVLADDIRDPDKWADWDPYAWIALTCRTEAEWQAEIDREQQSGKTGLAELLQRYPDFYSRLTQLRTELEKRTGRPLAIGVLDFGQAYWIDMGLHLTLRKILQSVIGDSPEASITRDIFRIPHDRDARGNTIIRSIVPDDADIRESVIIDSIITDPSSVIHGGMVVGGRHRKLHMPEGGIALFSASDDLRFEGPNGIAYRILKESAVLPAGGRLTTLMMPDELVHMAATESILDYKGDNYDNPILDNPLSFQQAANIMSRMNGQELDRRWLQIWECWLDCN